MRIRSLHFETYSQFVHSPLASSQDLLKLKIPWHPKRFDLVSACLYKRGVLFSSVRRQSWPDHLHRLVSTESWASQTEPRRGSWNIRTASFPSPEFQHRAAGNPETFDGLRLTQWSRFSIEAKSPNNHALCIFFYASQAFVWRCWALWIARKHLAVFDCALKS